MKLQTNGNILRIIFDVYDIKKFLSNRAKFLYTNQKSDNHKGYADNLLRLTLHQLRLDISKRESLKFLFWMDIEKYLKYNDKIDRKIDLTKAGFQIDPYKLKQRFKEMQRGINTKGKDIEIKFPFQYIIDGIPEDLEVIVKTNAIVFIYNTGEETISEIDYFDNFDIIGDDISVAIFQEWIEEYTGDKSNYIILSDYIENYYIENLL